MTVEAAGGHGECELSDTQALRRCVEAAGFREVRTRRHASTDTVLLLLSARKPAA